MKYTVTVGEKGLIGLIKAEYQAKGKSDAVANAKRLAKEYPNELVFISFYRSSDSQHGYINPDGAGITGATWTSI